MKKTFLYMIALCFISLATVNAQSPTPDPDTVSTPVKQTDPEVDVMPREVNYAGGMIEISTENLPKAVRQTLASGVSYEGWEKGKAYKDKDGRTYVIEMKEGDKTRVFRFNKEGKLILD